MTSALSPAELAHVNAIGIHDEDVFTDITTHADDTIPCDETHCPAAATWLVVARCGCARLHLCTDGLEGVKAHRDRQWRRLTVIACADCRRPFTATFDNVYRVVKL